MYTQFFLHQLNSKNNGPVFFYIKVHIKVKKLLPVVNFNGLQGWSCIET